MCMGLSVKWIGMCLTEYKVDRNVPWVEYDAQECTLD